jgi:heme-degrading monooxygenase HmoA
VVPRIAAATLYRVTILSYLRFSLTREADRQDFEKDMRSMLDLATRRPGYRWAEMGPSLLDPTVYLVVSEWDDVEQVRAWEHEEEHSGVMEKWEPQYREPLFHQRFVPWQRPAQ